MCGIGGCVLSPGSVPDEETLLRMRTALAHRGPDDAGIEVIGQVGLVHARLAVVDPTPAGHQPMRDSTGRWWLTYNGEIFNHRSLRTELGSAGWRSATDTETLLRGLCAWDERIVLRCNGLFAFAALDTVRGELLLVRDRFGVKPLYFARHDGGLWFASEIGALLAAGVPREPDDAAALRRIVAYGWVHGERTLLRHVYCVLPGTMLRVRLKDLEIRASTWFQPSDLVDRERMEALAQTNRHGLQGELENVLRGAVRRQLMGDVPIGTMCSGGVDSSLIAKFAVEEQPGIRVYNAPITDQPDQDEGRWAHRVAARAGAELRTVGLRAETFRRDLVEVVRHNEYPLRHESSVPMSQIARLAHNDGVKVLLSGDGADELFGGYDMRHGTSYRGFVSPVQRLRDRRRHVTAVALGLWRARGRGASQWRIARSRRDISAALAMPIDDASAEREAKTGFYEIGCAAYAHHRGSRLELEAGIMTDLSVFLPHVLNRGDKVTMRHSIETRVPFLDTEVVEFALNLPLDARVTPWRKGILRDLAGTRIGIDVARRAKVGFSFDVRGYLTDVADPNFLVNGYLRDLLGVPRETWRRATTGIAQPHVLRFWTTEIWCRLFPAGESVTTVESALWGERLSGG